MESAFVQSVDQGAKSKKKAPAADTDDSSDSMSDQELRLLDEAVSGGKPRRKPKKAEQTPSTIATEASSNASADAPAAEAAPKAGAKTSKKRPVRGRAQNDPPREPPRGGNAPEPPEDADVPPSDGEVDSYHKPGERKRRPHPKQIPWVWVVIVIIVAGALLYSWYDYTRGEGTRKDVRAFVAAVIIVIAVLAIYALVR